MQKPARHANQPIRLNGNNGPEGGGGSGGYPMRLCGAGGGQGASQPPTPQGPPQDKPPMPIHQAAHIQNHLAFPHVRQAAVTQHTQYYHQTQQIRAQRPHQYSATPRQPIVLSTPHIFGGQENYLYPMHSLMSVPLIYPSPAATAQLPPSDGGSGRSNSSNLNVQGGPNPSYSWPNNNPNMAALITPSHPQQPQPTNYPPQSFGYTPIRVPYASTQTLQQPQPTSQHHTVMVPPSMNNGGGGGGGGGGGVGGGGPLMSGNTGTGAATMAQGQGPKMKSMKRTHAIKIINPDTMEEVKMGEEEQSMQGDHPSAHSQHDLHNSVPQESVATVDRRISTDFAPKVVAAVPVETPVGSRTVENDEEEICVNGPTVVTVPTPAVHPPPSLPPPDIDTKRLPTPVVSAAAANTPTYDVHHNRSSSSRTESRSSGSPARSKVNTAVPPQSAVKSQPPPSLAPPLAPAPLFPPVEEAREVPAAQPKHQRKPREDKKPAAVAPPSVAPLVAAPAAAPAPVLAPVPTPIPTPPIAAPPPVQAQPLPQPLLPPKPVPVATPVQPSPPPPQVVSVEEKVIVGEVARSSPPPAAPVEEPTPAPVPTIAASPAPAPVVAPPPDIRKTNFADSLDIQKTAMAAMSALAASQPILTQPPPLMDEKIEEKPLENHPTGKALQKSRQKKAQKSREINQKGMEKEGGSDMDAFYDPRSVVRGEAGEQAGEVTSEVPARDLSPLPTAPPPSDLQDDENSDSSELALVSAKNEENAKLSQQNSEEEEIITQVIERSQAPSEPQLKYDYKDDQWSPLNPNGKKVYDRDFLLKLRKDPLSSKKPEHIKSDLDIFLKDKDLMNNNNAPMKNPLFPPRGGPFAGPSLGMQRGGNSFAPDWMSRSQNSSQRDRMMSKRSSQPGRPVGGSRSSNRMNYNSSLSLRDDFKLNQVENAWKPQKFQRSFDAKGKEDGEKEELFRNVRGILNKLTPQKFEILICQFKSLPINNIDRLQGTISLVFEKAVDEPAFSVCYADLCRTLAKMEVAAPPPASSTEETPDGQPKPASTSGINFRKLLINRCQQEFEANKKAEMDFEKKQQEINECKDADKRKELQLLFNEEERKIRMKSVGLLRFIVELYNFKILSAKIMHGCIRQLLERIDEGSLECFCKLIATIGKELEHNIQHIKDEPDRNRAMQEWNDYFIRMSKLSKKYDGTKVSSRVRFMLQDTIELRENKWVPR